MATIIDRGLAQSLIQEFRKQNKSSGEHAWKTPDGQHLHGFFIDRESLESLLKNKDNVGVHVYFAKHPDFAGKPDKIHTVALVGTQPNTAPGALTPYLNEGDVFDQKPPCPPYCGSL